jgi:hypothetical protein
MRALFCLLLVLALPGRLLARPPATAVPDQPPSSADRLLALDAEQIQQALSALQQRHVGSSALDGTELARATLRGLLDGLQPGAELTGGERPAPASVAFHSEILDGRVGYIRLGSLQTENLAQLEAALGGFGGGKTDGVVLDLRATPESQNFALAAEVAGRFVASGTTLFELVSRTDPSPRKFTSTSPLLRGVVVVVADSSTRGAAEAVAAVLRRHARALVVGTATAGRAVEFAELPLGEGQQLRLAVAEVKVDGLPPLFPGGLVPDVEVVQDAAVRDQIFKAAGEGSMAPFVFEQARAQMNEASLMAGTNPEIDSQPDGAETPAPLLDRPLQRALDLVTAIRLLRPAD